MTNTRLDPFLAPPPGPWNPTSIAVLTLIASPLVGGIFHSLNYGRLGRRHLQSYAFFRNFLAGSLLIACHWLLPYLAFNGISFLFAAYFYKTQEEDFRRYISQGGKKSSLVIVNALVLLGIAAFLLLIGLVAAR